ncbi:MAG: hypothetical protein WA405_02210 [Candidatus Acidiferrales bacterium]
MASTTTPARACEIIRPTDLHALGMVRGELARTMRWSVSWTRRTGCARPSAPAGASAMWWRT